jgi:hypothetical protein
MFATGNSACHDPGRRLSVACWIAAPAPSTTALVAIVRIAPPINAPASHEPGGRGGGKLPEFFNRDMLGSSVKLSSFQYA